MSLRPRLRLLLAAALALTCSTLRAAAPAQLPDGDIATAFLAESEPRPKLLLVGVFHFQDAGLDAYKPKHAFEPLTERRQREIADVVARLAAFKPTKVLIEAEPDFQPKADERLRAYLAGTFSLADRPNEIYQLGFRLAQAAGLTRVECIDAPGRDYPGMPQTMEELRALAAKQGEAALLDGPWDARFTALYEHDDELKSSLPLRESLLYVNSEGRLRRGHGHYLTGLFRVGAGGNFLGADNLAGYWYDRNLRIFANLLHAAEKPTDRLVVIFGAGHLPILRHAAQCSPELELVELRDVLGPPH